MVPLLLTIVDLIRSANGAKSEKKSRLLASKFSDDSTRVTRLVENMTFNSVGPYHMRRRLAA